MAFEIAWGIVLAILIIVAGIVTLAIFAGILRMVWTEVLVIAVLLTGFHFIGAWIFLLLFGFILATAIYETSGSQKKARKGIEH